MTRVGTLGDVITDTLRCMHEGCYNFTKNGECSKCGQCCSALLPLKKSEIVKLQKIIRERNLKPHKQLKVLAQQPMFDLTCPFLTDNNECSIYDDRPYICRSFRCDKGRPSEMEVRNLDEHLIPTNMRSLF